MRQQCLWFETRGAHLSQNTHTCLTPSDRRRGGERPGGPQPPCPAVTHTALGPTGAPDQFCWSAADVQDVPPAFGAAADSIP